LRRGLAEKLSNVPKDSVDPSPNRYYWVYPAAGRAPEIDSPHIVRSGPLGIYRVFSIDASMVEIAKSSRKKILFGIFRVAVTIAILLWVFRSPDLRKNISEAFAKANMTWILIGLPVAFGGELADILRLSVLMRVQGMVLPWGSLLRMLFIGLFFNLIMPGNSGLISARLLFLFTKFPNRKKEVVLTVVMDRLISVMALAITSSTTTLLRWNWLQRTAEASALLWILILLMTGSVILTAGSFVISSLNLLRKIPANFPMRRQLIEAADAYRMFARDKKSLSKALLLSLPILFFFYGTFYCAARALGAGISFLDVISIMPIVNAITGLPISVSGIGVRESLLEVLFKDLCNLPPVIGVSISVIGYSYFVLFGVIGGLVYLVDFPGKRRS
jgi:glycosyltransferase 2 family protein